MLAYFDLVAGISGDMILGALIDAGLPLASLKETVALLGLSNEVEVTAVTVRKGGLIATGVRVESRTVPDRGVHSRPPSRGLKEILAILRDAPLPAPVKTSASHIFQRLGEVEGRIHGIPPEEVHFHEVGAVDAIVDVVGAVAGLHTLGVTRVAASPVPLSRGSVPSAHGVLPVPAPATLALLAGCPVYGLDGVEIENVTPTGAAILSTLARSFGPLPAMTPQRTGYGAGMIDLPIPNVLRLLLGEESAPSGGLQTETLTVLSTQIDNMPGEWFGPLFDQLLAAGALDVWLTPVQMKKNRPGLLLQLLAEPLAAPGLRLILLRETTTLGVREETVLRWSLPREIQRAATPWGEVRVKVARLPDGSEKAAPEFDDCRRLAEAHQVPLREVYQTAIQSHAARTEQKEPF